MADHGREAGAGRWPLRGFALASFWFSAVVFVLVLVGGVFLMVTLWVGDRPVWALAPGLVLLGVAALIGSQMLRIAVVVTLHADGTLILRRLLGTLHTHAARVQRASPSILNRSGRRTPTVIKTADGSVLLTHSRRDVDEVITALRRHRPDLAVDL